MKCNKKVFGFTMAEVLITLGIIGIVAEITIPALYNNFAKQTTVTTLKKAYTELSQALKMAVVDNGDFSSWVFVPNSVNITTTKDFTNTYIYPYIKTIKKCDNGDTSCWADTVALDNTPTSSSDSTSANTTGISAVTASGYSVFFSTTSNINPGFFIFDIYIDINGTKPPNRVGRDVFCYKIRNTGNGIIQPNGWATATGSIINRTSALTNTSYGCSSNSTGTQSGRYCAALIMADNWQISDDYYWH